LGRGGKAHLEVTIYKSAKKDRIKQENVGIRIITRMAKIKVQQIKVQMMKAKTMRVTIKQARKAKEREKRRRKRRRKRS